MFVLIPIHPIEFWPHFCPIFLLIRFHLTPSHPKQTFPMASPIDLMRGDFYNEFCRVISDLHQWQTSWWSSVFFMKSQVLGSLLACLLVNFYWSFEGYQSFFHQDQAHFDCWGLKLTVLPSFETKTSEEPISFRRTQNIFDIIIIIFIIIWYISNNYYYINTKRIYVYIGEIRRKETISNTQK
jgi:hypothetical protein